MAVRAAPLIVILPFYPLIRMLLSLTVPFWPRFLFGRYTWAAVLIRLARDPIACRLRTGRCHCSCCRDESSTEPRAEPTATIALRSARTRTGSADGCRSRNLFHARRRCCLCCPRADARRDACSDVAPRLSVPSAIVGAALRPPVLVAAGTDGTAARNGTGSSRRRQRGQQRGSVEHPLSAGKSRQVQPGTRNCSQRAQCTETARRGQLQRQPTRHVAVGALLALAGHADAAAVAAE